MLSNLPRLAQPTCVFGTCKVRWRTDRWYLKLKGRAVERRQLAYYIFGIRKLTGILEL